MQRFHTITQHKFRQNHTGVTNYPRSTTETKYKKMAFPKNPA